MNEENIAKNHPDKKFRAGAISVTLWKNQVKKETGDSHYYSITLERNYKDKEGNWKSTGSLRSGDLPKAALLLNKAYEYLVISDPPAANDLEIEEEIVI